MSSTNENTNRIRLLEATPAELAELLGSEARARTLRGWLSREVPPEALPDTIPGLSRRVWAGRRGCLTIPAWRVVTERRSADGTVKLAVDLAGSVAEAVLIPGPRRSTVCLSSQSGCTRSCAFCATATLGFGRQLRAEEIVVQYLLAQRFAPSGKPARNVVFMGMGEPFDNLDEVLKAVAFLTDDLAPGLSPAHVTVSTSGVVPGVERFLRESSACLALSLNATTDEVRRRLMPHNRIWPIAALLDAIRRNANGRAVFVEYVLFDGINDSIADATRLVGLLAGIAARVNLIPFNGYSGASFREPSPATVTAFHAAVAAAGIRCLIRQPRGRDIAGACGQLAGGR